MAKLAPMLLILCTLGACAERVTPVGPAAPALTVVEAVKAQVRAICRVVPFNESIEALLEAANGAYSIDNLARIACGGLRVADTFSSGRDKVVSGVAHINGVAVPVSGTVR